MTLPPGPRTPAILQMLDWLRDPAGMLERSFSRFGPTFSLNSPLFGTEAIFTRPATLRAILTADGETLAGGEANAIVKPLIGPTSVLVLDGAPHLAMRRRMLSAFHTDRMLRTTDTMRETTERALVGFGAGDPIKMHPLLQRITLDMILRAVLGLGDGPEQARVRDAIIHVL
jgi:cytochrome P450